MGRKESNNWTSISWSNFFGNKHHDKRQNNANRRAGTDAVLGRRERSGASAGSEEGRRRRHLGERLPRRTAAGGCAHVGGGLTRLAHGAGRRLVRPCRDPLFLEMAR